MCSSISLTTPRLGGLPYSWPLFCSQAIPCKQSFFGAFCGAVCSGADVRWLPPIRHVQFHVVLWLEPGCGSRYLRVVSKLVPPWRSRAFISISTATVPKLRNATREGRKTPSEPLHRAFRFVASHRLSASPCGWTTQRKPLGRTRSGIFPGDGDTRGRCRPVNRVGTQLWGLHLAGTVSGTVSVGGGVCAS